MIKAVIFDFDGTLVDTMGSIWAEYERTMEEMKLPKITHREFTRHVGRAWNEIIKTFWPDLNPAEFTRHYHVEDEEVKPFKGGEEALKELSKTYTLALMTSRGKKTLFPNMTRAGLEPGLFKLIHHRNSLTHNKPDPRALLQVCKELKIKPSETIYIGDSIIDAECAQKAGAGFVAVLSGGAYPDDFKAMGVKDIIPSIAQLPSLLKREG